MYKRFCAVIFCALPASGCGYIMPSFSYGPMTGAYTYRMPVNEVESQIECEIGQFRRYLRQDKNPHANLAKFVDNISVDLMLETDVAGSVSYIGFDLHKIGLGGLTRFIALDKNGNPSLGAAIKWKGVTKATLTFKIPHDTGQTDISSCSHRPSIIASKFYLADWLIDFAHNQIDTQDIKKIVLEKQFAIGLDMSTGLLPLNGTSFILPINSLNADIYPAYTHDVKITFGEAGDNGGSQHSGQPDNPTTHMPVILRHPQPHRTS